jgi:hypothetical protein
LTISLGVVVEDKMEKVDFKDVVTNMVDTYALFGWVDYGDANFEMDYTFDLHK